MNGTEIPLTEVIRELRGQLMDAIEAGSEEELRFGVEELELELQVVVTKNVGAKVGAEGTLKFWVLNALGKGEISGSYESSRLQKLRLKLKPKTADGSGVDLAG